jgi:hypothetical protein
MTRTTMIGAALALLLTGAAFAQTETAPGTPPPPPPPAAAPGPDAVPPPPPPGGSMDAESDNEGGDEARPDRDRGPRHGDMRGHGWRHHGDRHGPGRDGRGMGPAPSKGAAFRLNLADGSRLGIRCADEDSTQECVEAIMPMLDRILPGASDTMEPAPAQ